MSIPLRSDSDRLPQPRPLRLVPVDVLRRRADAYRQTSRPRSPRRWVQLVLPDVSTEATRERARRPRVVRLRVAPPRLAQVELDFPIGVRVTKREALARIGKDPDPDAPWEETPERIRRFAEHFPDGMSFAEIGEVLGTRKQQIFKIYVRALAKLGLELGPDEERIREALQSGAESRSAWESMMDV